MLQNKEEIKWYQEHRRIVLKLDRFPEKIYKPIKKFFKNKPNKS